MKTKRPLTKVLPIGYYTTSKSLKNTMLDRRGGTHAYFHSTHDTLALAVREARLLAAANGDAIVWADFTLTDRADIGPQIAGAFERVNGRVVANIKPRRPVSMRGDA